jgi:hypothetical protein
MGKQCGHSGGKKASAFEENFDEGRALQGIEESGSYIN